MRIKVITVASATLFAFVSLAHAQTTPTSTSRPAVRRPSTTAPAAKPVEAPKPKSFTNDDVIKLKTAEFADDAIAAAIEAAQNKQFDISADGLITLKTAGVSQPVINVMLGKPYVPAPAVAAAPLAPPAPANVRFVEPATVPAPAAEAAKPEKKGFWSRTVGSVIRIENKDKKEGESNPEEVRVKDGEAAVIKVEMPAQAAETQVKAYFNSKNIDFTVNPETNRIISGWYGARRCGPGIQHCEYKAHVRVANEPAATELHVQVYERKREGGASPKGWNENNKSKGEWTSKFVAELRAALARTNTATTASR